LDTTAGEVKAGATRRAEELSAELARRLVNEQARNERQQAQLKRDLTQVERRRTRRIPSWVK